MMSEETNTTIIATEVAEESRAIAVPAAVKPIVLEAPVADASNDYRVKVPSPCEACGGPAHGPTMKLIDCLTQHMRIARSLANLGPPRTCAGCGQGHRSIDEMLTCLEEKLSISRAKVRVGVSPEEFKLNQAQSAHFEQIRGKNKKGGGQ